MRRIHLKKIGLRLAAVSCAVVATLALTATPALAATDNLNITTSWGWGSAVVTWPESPYHATYHITVNDSITDGWCVQGRLAFYDYDGTYVSARYVTDCSTDGVASSFNSENEYFGFHSVFSATLRLCKYNPPNTYGTCQPLQYAYRTF